MQGVQKGKAGNQHQPSGIKPAFGRFRQKLFLREMQQNMGKKVSRIAPSIPLRSPTPISHCAGVFLKKRFVST
jgi:hypothetical protein